METIVEAVKHALDTADALGSDLGQLVVYAHACDATVLRKPSGERPPKRSRRESHAATSDGGVGVQILITQRPDSEAAAEIAIAGLQAVEYGTDTELGPKQRNIAYLQYVDTTGQCTPRHYQRSVAQALVRGYLRSLEQRGFVRCHLFASRAPEYLFHESEKCAEKTRTPAASCTLSEANVKLATWWADTFAQSPDAVAVFVHTIGRAVPSSVISRLGTKYRSGLPYPSDATVGSHVPMFPDDAKAAAVVTMTNVPSRAALNVATFFALLDSGIESAKQPSIFVVDLVVEATTVTHPATLALPSTSPTDLFRASPGVSFASTAQAQSSTHALINTAKPSHQRVITLQHAPRPPAPMTAAPSAVSTVGANKAPVNVVPVRRKSGAN